MQKILLIEDDTYIRDVFKEVLIDAGFVVEEAFDGAEGLNKAQLGGYDLIFLDMMMPKLDGLGVLKGLQLKPPQKKNGPIVLLTNLGHDPVIDEGIKLGAKSYMIKTDITPDQLVLKAKDFLSRQS